MQEEHLQRRQLLETRRLAKCYLNYISNHRDQVQPLFELLTVVSHKTRCDYTFVKDFYLDLVADKFTVEEKKRVSGTAPPSMQSALYGSHTALHRVLSDRAAALFSYEWH